MMVCWRFMLSSLLSLNKGRVIIGGNWCGLRNNFICLWKFGRVNRTTQCSNLSQSILLTAPIGSRNHPSQTNDQPKPLLFRSGSPSFQPFDFPHSLVSSRMRFRNNYAWRSFGEKKSILTTNATLMKINRQH